MKTGQEEHLGENEPSEKQAIGGLCWLPERADRQTGEEGGHDMVKHSEMYHAPLPLVVGKRSSERETHMWSNHHTTLLSYTINKARLLASKVGGCQCVSPVELDAV